MVEEARAAALARAFVALLKGDEAPPDVATVSEISAELPAQFAVFQIQFGNGDERYRVEVRRE